MAGHPKLCGFLPAYPNSSGVGHSSKDWSKFGVNDRIDRNRPWRYPATHSCRAGSFLATGELLDLEGFRTGSGFAASAVEPILNDHIAGAALAKGFKPSRKLVDLLVGKFLNRGFNLCDATHEGSEYSCR